MFIILGAAAVGQSLYGYKEWITQFGRVIKRGEIAESDFQPDKYPLDQPQILTAPENQLNPAEKIIADFLLHCRNLGKSLF